MQRDWHVPVTRRIRSGRIRRPRADFRVSPVQVELQRRVRADGAGPGRSQGERQGSSCLLDPQRGFSSSAESSLMQEGPEGEADLLADQRAFYRARVAVTEDLWWDPTANVCRLPLIPPAA